MAHTELTVTNLRPGKDPARVVVLAPGLGTALIGTWDVVAESLATDCHVIAVDLPGHGRSPAWDPEKSEPSITALAHALDAVVKSHLEETGLQNLPVHFAGISLGGALALQLALDHTETFDSAVVICSAAKIGQPGAWADRAAFVRTEGTAQLVDGSISRWFAPGFSETSPDQVKALTDALEAADSESYALLCETLGAFDVRSRLGEISMPLMVIAGEHDTPTPPSQSEEIGAAVANSRVHVVANAAHQVPTEQPQVVAELLNDFFSPKV